MQEEYTMLDTLVDEDTHKILFRLIQEAGTEKLERRLKEVMELFEIDAEYAMCKAEEALYQDGGDFTDGELLSGLNWLNGEDIPNLTYIQ